MVFAGVLEETVSKSVAWNPCRAAGFDFLGLIMPEKSSEGGRAPQTSTLDTKLNKETALEKCKTKLKQAILIKLGGRRQSTIF